MAWIESHTSLARHPKTIRLAKALDTSVPAAIGHLHLLWWWALEYAQDGDLSQYEPDEIAEAACYEGDGGEFLAALQRARFVESDGQLHDWEDYAGRLLEKRRTDADRVKRWRDARRTETPPPSINSADDTRNVRGTYAVTVPNRTVPNRTVPNQSAGAEAPPRAEESPPEKKPRAVRRTEIDEEFVVGLIDKYADVFSEQEIRDKVEAALGYKSARNYTDLKAYVRNWIGGDARKERGNGASRRQNGLAAGVGAGAPAHNDGYLDSLGW